MTEMTKGNAFLDALTEAREGTALADLHAAILQLVGDVRSIGKKGTLTVTLNIALGSANTLVLTDTIKVVSPEPNKDSAIYYADDANRLTRTDPRQPTLKGLREVATFARPMAVNETTGEITE